MILDFLVTDLEHYDGRLIKKWNKEKKSSFSELVRTYVPGKKFFKIFPLNISQIYGIAGGVHDVAPFTYVHLLKVNRVKFFCLRKIFFAPKKKYSTKVRLSSTYLLFLLPPRFLH